MQKKKKKNLEMEGNLQGRMQIVPQPGYTSPGEKS